MCDACHDAQEALQGVEAFGLTLGDLVTLPDWFLADLEYSAKEALEQLDRDAATTVVAEARIGQRTLGVASSHATKVDSLASRLQNGRISREDFDAGMHDAIAADFRKAYELELGRPLDEGDLEYLRRATEAEMEFARRFGQAIEDDALIMPRGERSAMYGRTVEGIAWHARTEAQPDDVRVDWVLGKAEHCPDCLILAANGPYNKWNLPTTPRAGGTQCLSNCKCWLRYTTGQMSQAEKEDAAEYALKKDQSLADLTKAPRPPRGMRAASVGEARYIQSLRNRINFQRRRIAQREALTDGELSAAIKARRDANRELVEFLEREGIHEVPLLSVDEVIDGRHLGRRALGDLFRDGIDGRSLTIMERRRLESLIARFEDELGDSFADGEILRRLGQ